MKKILYGIGIAMAVLFVQQIYGKVIPEKSASASAEVLGGVNSVFEKNSIYEADCDIEAYYYIGNRYYGESGSQEILDKIAESLGVNSVYYYDKRETDTGSIATIQKQGKNASLSLELITTEESLSKNVISQKNYISIRLEIKDSLESGYYYKKLVEDTIKKVISDEKVNEDISEQNVNDNIYMIIKGKIYGKADLEKQKNIAAELIKRLGAKEVFSSDKGDYSLYGYSKTIDDYVAIGSEKINVNIAYSYDENANITYIYIGSPIVNYDY